MHRDLTPVPARAARDFFKEFGVSEAENHAENPKNRWPARAIKPWTRESAVSGVISFLLALAGAPGRRSGRV